MFLTTHRYLKDQKAQREFYDVILESESSTTTILKGMQDCILDLQKDLIELKKQMEDK